MGNCSVCGKEISGIEEFGNIHTPQCRNCWFDDVQVTEDAEPDSRYYDIPKSHRHKVGTVVTCIGCHGTGKRTLNSGTVIECFKCSGYGKLIGEICDSCDGKGEVDHHCDCRICTAEHEDCDDCGGVGVYFAPYPTDAPFLPENIKTYWVKAS